MQTLPGAAGAGPIADPATTPGGAPSAAAAAEEGGAAAGGEPRWYLLQRRAGHQRVSGQVKLSFEWTFTLDGLLSLEVAQLEQLLRLVGARGRARPLHWRDGSLIDRRAL
jgi:hypothetical protein